MKKISSWGNISKSFHQVHYLMNKESVIDLIKSRNTGISYGMGRSYGDVCLNPGGSIFKNEYLDRLINFDENLGELECESGICLKMLQDFLVPKGWMLPVSPGTEYVSIGGAIANDIHGKNHHQFGSFGNHILEICLIRSDSGLTICSPEVNKEIFYATIGGIGLTGFILSCKLKLKKVPSPWLETESIAFNSLDSFYKLSDESEEEWEYTAAWIDCLSYKSVRGIFERGRHTNFSKEFIKKSFNFPFTPPFSVVNTLSIRIFNPIYFYIKKFFPKRKVQHYKKFLHPLDNILHWNKMYGPKGFYQFQCVLPRDNSKEAIESILRVMNAFNAGSFLAVLKTFSNCIPVGLLSFASPGVTLAIDFVNHGIKTKKLFLELEQIVKIAGGKIYLAKDSLMSREVFENSYEHLDDFRKYIDPKMSSQMSRRLIGK